MAYLIRNTQTEPAPVDDKPLVPAFFRRFSQETVLFVGLLLLVFWLAALVSHDTADPAWSTTGVYSEPRNWLGHAGAWVADISYFLLGRSVWLLFLALFAGWVRLFRSWIRGQMLPEVAGVAQADNIGWRQRWLGWFDQRLVWWLALLVLLASAAGLEWSRLYAGAASLPGGAGGMLGSFVGPLMQSFLGGLGSGVLGIVLLVAAFAWVFRFSWGQVSQQIGAWIEQRIDAARTRREVAADVAAGQEAARQREVEVEQELEQVRENHPIPVAVDMPVRPLAAEPSVRVAKERQKPLFTELPDSTLPQISLLDEAPANREAIPHETLEMTSRLIEKKLKDFGVEVRVVAAKPGPVVTRYEMEPATGVKGSQIVNLAKDLARSLSLVSIRVVENIPGKNLMALELPNARRQTIHLSEVLGSNAYHDGKSLLTVGLGKDIVGTPIVADLAKMPHVMVAGTTGSGKSVGINAMILSLLYKASPEQVRLLMIDPKMLEMSVYEDIPHLIAPVVTDMRQAAHGLNWCVGEMERRYKLMSKMGVRNLAGYNAKIEEAKAREELIPNPFSLTPDSPEPLERLPYLVVVIDELADLMMVVGKKIEELIARLAQKARAAGIHLILATQRPSVDVITGLIKANIPTRIAFQVSSKIDSRTILDQMGAESLLGMGDMLYLPSGQGMPTRVHGAFVSDDEVHRVVTFLKEHGEPNYIEGVLEGGTVDGEEGGADGQGGGEQDPMYDQAVEVVLKKRKASISLVQRELRIGYNRAARLLEDMERAGLVSSLSSSGQRDILVPNRDE
ncbi:DNA translocase FtsK 4TM domain-containing protein [Brachymonas sp. G13]|uniref:DNA translocase FtsK n=1 Tax=Brachymonas TaxID=28219 RepID=UPI0016ABC6E6|nr:DNA translocase FtsK 4TM domain-containing protein [Brachymonas sp. J145]MEE1653041.1 DNA translocase FtsK 4TM domain-containing protein [Brachymonas sp. J145]NLX16233.1 DNA translocase FtsK [Ramlibacter sp.]